MCREKTKYLYIWCHGGKKAVNRISFENPHRPALAFKSLHPEFAYIWLMLNFAQSSTSSTANYAPYVSLAELIIISSRHAAHIFKILLSRAANVTWRAVNLETK